MKKLIALFAVAGVVGSSVAAPFSIDFLGTGLGQSVSVSSDSGATFSNTFAGRLIWQAAMMGGVFQTVCADVRTGVLDPQMVNKVNSWGYSVGIDLAGRIVKQHFSSTDTNLKAAALQLAVWEALYDGGAAYDKASGVFQVSNGSMALHAQAALYYAAISTPGNALYLEPDPIGRGQAQLTVVPGPAAAALPLIWIGSAISRRRKSKSA